jgi:hypothetical protein
VPDLRPAGQRRRLAGRPTSGSAATRPARSSVRPSAARSRPRRSPSVRKPHHHENDQRRRGAQTRDGGAKRLNCVTTAVPARDGRAVRRVLGCGRRNDDAGDVGCSIPSVRGGRLRGEPDIECHLGTGAGACSLAATRLSAPRDRRPQHWRPCALGRWCSWFPRQLGRRRRRSRLRRRRYPSPRTNSLRTPEWVGRKCRCSTTPAPATRTPHDDQAGSRHISVRRPRGVGLPAARVTAARQPGAAAAPDGGRVLVAVLPRSRVPGLQQPVAARVGSGPVEDQHGRPVLAQRALDVTADVGVLGLGERDRLHSCGSCAAGLVGRRRCRRCGRGGVAVGAGGTVGTGVTVGVSSGFGPPGLRHGHGSDSQFVFSSARPPPAGGHPGEQRHVVGGTAQ